MLKIVQALMNLMHMIQRNSIPRFRTEFYAGGKIFTLGKRDILQKHL